jgi:hypothetical protein
VIPSTGGGFVDFQYDQVLTALTPGSWIVAMANTANPALGSAAIVGGPGVGNTVRVQCPVCASLAHESIVSAWSVAGAATGAGGASTAGGLPAGGNAGAFASGFTVAPEALTVSFDNATNVAHVLFDQRWQVDNSAMFRLIDDQGSQISAAAINVSGAGAPTAGKTAADITFPAGTLSGARSLLIQTGAVSGNALGNGSNRTQVISPTAPGVAAGAQVPAGEGVASLASRGRGRTSRRRRSAVTRAGQIP